MDYEDEAAAGASRSGEPPRSQERRREPRQVDQMIPLRCPAAEFGTDEQARGQGATTLIRAGCHERDDVHRAPALGPSVCLGAFVLTGRVMDHGREEQSLLLGPVPGRKRLPADLDGGQPGRCRS